MSSNVANSGPFLKQQRKFPMDMEPLVLEIDRAYTDISNKVNDRTIGLFIISQPIITGDKWIESGVSRTSFRRVFRISGTGAFNHGIDFTTVIEVTALRGMFTDGTSWYTLPYTDVTAVSNQILVTINATQIVITSGAGTPPTITNGTVVVEWL